MKKRVQSIFRLANVLKIKIVNISVSDYGFIDTTFRTSKYVKTLISVFHPKISNYT
jgi:hypothetical protein